MSNSLSSPTCSQWAEKLAVGHPEDLSPSERAILNAHLATCSACADAYAAYQAVHLRLRTLPLARTLPSSTPYYILSGQQTCITQKHRRRCSAPSLSLMKEPTRFGPGVFQQAFSTALTTFVVACLLVAWIVLTSYLHAVSMAPRILPQTTLTGAAPTSSPDRVPTAIPTFTSEAIAVGDAEHYEELIVTQESGAFHGAYNLLSPELRDKLSFDEFLNNSNYALSKGCWTSGQVTDSPIDSSMWNVNIIMQQISCVDGVVLVPYSWHFRVQMVGGLPEIVSVGLYPIGTG